MPCSHLPALVFGFRRAWSRGAWGPLACFPSCRGGVGRGAETELGDAAPAHRLDAHSHQVSGLQPASQRAQECDLLPWSAAISASSLTPRQINILDRRRVYTALHSIYPSKWT